MLVQIMNPAFHRSQPIKTFGGVMPYLFDAIDENPDKVMITKHIKAFTLDSLGLAVFGESYTISEKRLYVHILITEVRF